MSIKEVDCGTAVNRCGHFLCYHYSCFADNKNGMKKGARKRPLVDTLTYGLLQAFSYIKWPGTSQLVAQYSEILQMDVFQIAPIHCLFPGFRVNAFGSLFTMTAMNAAVIGFSAITYGVRKAIILRSRSLQNDDKSRSMVFRDGVQKPVFLPVCDLPEHVRQDSQCPATCLPETLPR